MRKTRFIQKILSALTSIIFASLSGNMAFCGQDLTFPGIDVELDGNNDLTPRDPSGNNVTILEGIIRNVYGGKFGSKEVTNNTVTISGGEILTSVFGGQGLEAVHNNTVTISEGKIGSHVFGGFSFSGVVTENTVTISGGEISGNVSGGQGLEAVDNTVTVSGGEILGSVMGGFSSGGVATGNTVTILDGKTGSVTGGFSSGNATGNIVQILGGEISGYVTGGGSSEQAATGNTVTISGGGIEWDIYGGKSTSGVATGNTVIISGGEIGAPVYGGYSASEEATGNTVAISDGEIGGSVIGGRAIKGVATGNFVIISGGEIGGNVYGGYSEKGIAKGNSVTISGGAITGNVTGGESDYESGTGNTVTISGGVITGNVIGGAASNGAVTSNTVMISGGNISGNVFGGEGYMIATTSNTVMISGGNISGNVFGGKSYSSKSVTGNTVKISGGGISGDIYGGNSYSGEATDNIVILDSGASLSATSSIFGGFSANENADMLTGNKLVLNDFQGTVKQIANFEFIDITSSGKEGDMLTLAGDEITDLSQSKVNITFTGISRPFNTGDKINLIKNEKGITVGSGTLQQEGQKQVKGTVYIYDLLFDSDENTIHAIVESKKFNDRSKALAEGRVASMAHLNMGADLIAGQGMAQALDSDKLTGKIHLFSAMAATNSQYDTGSHVDLYGYSALVGASLAPAALPSLNCGVFAESGWGHYGSFSDFEDGAVRGSGSTQYYGGGLLTHYDFTKMGIKGLTVEASFRAGKTDTDYQSGDLTNSKYDLSTPYYGVHAGVNYTRELSAKLKIANYARFFWSHLDGDNTSIEGSDFRFRTMDSQRIKAGSRLFYEIAPDITPYAGLSYEWECSGTARAVVDGVNGMAAPSLRGGTGTGELGAVWKPMAHQAFWVDFSAQGHVGNRQGVSGVVRVRAEF